MKPNHLRIQNTLLLLFLIIVLIISPAKSIKSLEKSMVSVQESVNIAVEADTYIYMRPSSSNINYGDSEIFVLGGDSDGYKYDTLLKYDIASNIPTNVTILSAELHVVDRREDGAFWGFPFFIYPVSEPWNELTVTANSRPAYHQDIEINHVLDEENQEMVFEVGEIVQKWVSGEIDEYGLYLTANVLQNTESFYAKEAAEFTSELIVTYLQPGIVDCASLEDTDGDALYDGWEACGYDYDKDGQIDVDLPAMGADPFHKDIFVEVDYMLGGDGDANAFKPSAEAIYTIIASFDNAPIPANDSNPNNGVTGIHLHVDFGSEAFSWGPEGVWGDLSKSNTVEYKEFFGVCSEAINPEYNWSEFRDYQSIHLTQARESLFHYSIWVNSLCPEKSNLLGLSNNKDSSFNSGASDFIITIGETENTFRGRNKEAGTFMHELGHNLGLMHGGNEHIEFKPNYISVMNYSYALGIPINGIVQFDYSRFNLPILYENNLNESEGIQVLSNNSYGIIWLCRNSYSGRPTTNDFFLDLDSSSVNWDCDNYENELSVKSNINGDAYLNIPIFNELHSHDDWNAIVFDGGVIGALEIIGDERPTLTEINEITTEIIDALPEVYNMFIPIVLEK